MNKEDLLNLISDTDEKAFEQFIGANDSKMVIDSSFKSVEYDYSWISKIEDTLVYLDNIIRNPKRFIMQEEEVVPVEKAKKISQETIKHLAQHTDLIQDVDEDGTITPSKVLNVNKEESFDMYENRFIISLLNNLNYFFQLRKEVTKSGSFSTKKQVMNYTGKTRLDKEEINVTINLESNSSEDLSGVSGGGNIEERLAKIDEAQKKIDGLSTEIVSLESILTDKKSRGIFGEVNLYHILSSIFGEKNDKIYRTQYTLPNSYIADAIVFGPEPLGTICIDSKFPLENYRRLVEKGLSDREKELRSKLFEADVKKHIDAIATKYIIPGVTSDQAIMFLPAEAIFAEINAYHTSLVKYAASKKVWITSPTTIMGLLTIIQSVLMGLERDKYTSVIHEELNKLGVEFGRYRERWDKLSRTIQTVNNDVENIHKTTEKITKRFDSINNVKIENNDINSIEQ